MFWSSPVESSVYLLPLVCYSWSVHWKKSAMTQVCINVIWYKTQYLWFCFFWTGWFDPAVWWDHEGKHQCKDCLWLLYMCHHLWLGFRHEKVRIQFILVFQNHSDQWVSVTFIHQTVYVFVNLLMQVSWVASKQPDDPPKCRPDERTWVCVPSSQLVSLCFYCVRFFQSKVFDYTHICLCTAFTGQKWWSSSSSLQTCLSCRWRWMYTLLWKRYKEELYTL